MFRKNQKHQQLEMFSTVQSLRDDQQKLLDGSWAGIFYRELFCRLDERPFAVLYSDEASRPNVPVNVLIGLEVLKAGFGWSDAEMCSDDQSSNDQNGGGLYGSSNSLFDWADGGQRDSGGGHGSWRPPPAVSPN